MYLPEPFFLAYLMQLFRSTGLLGRAQPAASGSKMMFM